MSIRYYFQLPDPAQARGDDPRFAFQSHGAQGFARELQEALREDTLFQNWRAAQQDPDAVDPSVGVIDPEATVVGRQNDLKMDLVVNTSIPGSILKHRLRLLAGDGWTLRDVKKG